MHGLKYFVVHHFKKMKRIEPSVEDALLFIATELAEASELILRTKDYKRNHEKESYTPERFAEELGDIIYMAIIAGYVKGVDPVDAMIEKMIEELP